MIEEWRGRLGAGSRIRDQQLPLLYHQSRYAERLPIGKPDDPPHRAGRPAARVLRHLVPPGSDGGRRRRRHRPRADRSRIRRLRSAHGARPGRGPSPTRGAAARELLVNVAVGSGGDAVVGPAHAASGRPRASAIVGDYRRRLVEQLFAADVQRAVRRAGAQGRTRSSWARASAAGSLSPPVDTFSLSARVAGRRRSPTG